MTYILKKGQRLEDVLPKHTLEKTAKKLDSAKFVGIIKLKEDPLKIQRKLRDEWE